VEGWKKNEQQLGWKIRTIAAGEFRIIVKYLAPAESSGGSYTVKIDQYNANKTENRYSRQSVVLTDPKNTTVLTQELGTVRLLPGSYFLQLNADTIDKTELMKLLEIQLIPTGKSN
jgi:hypothetical protein